MELVYLWVEEYKNIQKQGFNFSPRFDCKFHDEYDEDGKLKDNCKLEIKENDDYIENFFGNNINVTAIVGKNGSGKSRLLELITLFRFEKLEEYLQSKTIVMVFRNNDKLYIPHKYSASYVGDSFKSFDINNIVNQSTFEIHMYNTIQHDSLFWLTLFTNGLSDFTEGKAILQGNHFESFYNGSYNFGDNEEYKFYRKFSSLLKDNTDIFNILGEDFIFDKMYFELDLKNISQNIYDDKRLKEIQIFFVNNIDNSSHTLGKEAKIITKETLVYNFLVAYFLERYVHIVNDPPRHFKRDEFKEYFLKKVITVINSVRNELKQKIKDNDTFIVKMNLILSTIKEQYHALKDAIYESCKDKKGEINHFEMNVTELEHIKNYEEIISYMIANFEIDSNSLKLKSTFKNINQNNIVPFYELLAKNDFYDDLYRSGNFYLNFIHSKRNHITFNSLSTGEKQLIKFVTNFIYTLIDTNYDSRMIFLDEIETSFHPQWQKKFINIVMKFINEIREKKLISKKNEYHLIFVTHSPFILSDIPREHIIFLDKYEKEDLEVIEQIQLIGNCKIVSGLKEKKQTFGANIHTLLSDSFFMEDGLMGEFAKGKINEIIDFHKVTEKHKHETCLKKIYEKRKTKFWQTQNIIGEKYLKQIIKNHLVEIEKTLLGKDGAKKEEIERTKAYLEQLEND